MNLEMRLENLRGYWAAWQKGHTPELAYGILAGIGYLRHSEILGEILQNLRKIEIGVRRNLEPILVELGKFMSESALPAKVQALTQSPKDGALQADFYQDRTASELAWQIAKEYVDEEMAKNWEVIGKVRDILDKVDDEILFHRELVESLQKIGGEEPLCYFDPDFFWWLPAERGECYLPSHRRNEYMAMNEENLLSSALKPDFMQHFLTCRQCRELYEMLRGIVPSQSI